LARVAFDEKGELSEIEAEVLVMAYHYLFSERLGKLFDRAHDMLWMHFEARADQENLLSLFKHSSLYWRLRGLGDRERICIERARLIIIVPAKARLGEVSANMAYFLLRCQAMEAENLKLTASPVERG